MGTLASAPVRTLETDTHVLVIANTAAPDTAQKVTTASLQRDTEARAQATKEFTQEAALKRAEVGA